MFKSKEIPGSGDDTQHGDKGKTIGLTRPQVDGSQRWQDRWDNVPTRHKVAGGAAAVVVVGGCAVCAVLNAPTILGNFEGSESPNTGTTPLESPTPTEAGTRTDSSVVYVTTTPFPTDFALTETATPTPTPIQTQATNNESISLQADILNTRHLSSDYFAWENRLGTERNGVISVDREAFLNYFSARQEAAEGKYPEILVLDKTFNILYNELGFRVSDSGSLRTLQDLRTSQAPDVGGALTSISSIDSTNPEVRRMWTIAKAKDFEEVVWRSVDEWIVVQIPGSNPQDANNEALQNLRKREFDQIIEALGVSAADDGDGRWYTVSDTFSVQTHYNPPAQYRELQGIACRPVNFAPNTELAGNNSEDETVFKLDSENDVLVAAVINERKGLIITVFQLASPVDPDPQRVDEAAEKQNENQDGARVEGDPWKACGPQVQVPVATGVVPTNIPSTNIPPTGVPPTEVPPTGVPPTGVPTDRPPTNIPTQPAPQPTQDLPPTNIPTQPAP